MAGKWVTDGYDLHLVGPEPEQGGTRAFNLRDYFVPAGTGTLVFDPVFNFTGATHGVEVSVGGTLTFFGAPLPPLLDPVRNFIVTVTEAKVTGGAFDPVAIRIHRHDELTDAVVTPAQLSIRVGAQMQFSILATFRDRARSGQLASVGDISRQPALQWSVASDPSGALLALPTGQFQAVLQGFTAGVQVLLPDSLYPAGALPPNAQRTKTAAVTTLAAWDDEVANDFELTRADGPNVPIASDARNVLFLPDGIDDKGKFKSLVDTAVAKLSTYDQAEPYKSLLNNGQVNVWWAWIPSPETGGMELNELRPNNAGSRSRRDVDVRVVPLPRVAAAGAPVVINDVRDLIYRVGLPTAAAAAATGQTLATQKGHLGHAVWPDVHAASVTQDIFDRWQGAATRDSCAGGEGHWHRKQGSAVFAAGVPRAGDVE